MTGVMNVNREMMVERLAALADRIPAWWIPACKIGTALMLTFAAALFLGVEAGKRQERTAIEVISTSAALERGYFTTGEVAIREKVAQRTVSHWCQTGRIPKARKGRGGKWRIPTGYIVLPPGGQQSSNAASNAAPPQSTQQNGNDDRNAATDTATPQDLPQPLPQDGDDGGKSVSDTDSRQ